MEEIPLKLERICLEKEEHYTPRDPPFWQGRCGSMAQPAAAGKAAAEYGAARGPAALTARRTGNHGLNIVDQPFARGKLDRADGIPPEIDRVGRHRRIGRGVGIPHAVEAARIVRKIAGADMDPQSVSRLDTPLQQNGRQLDIVALPGLHRNFTVHTFPVAHAENRIADEKGAAIRKDVDDLHGEIGVGTIGRHG